MPTYVTYLEVSLNPKSAAPTEIVSSLKNLGWKPVFGQYDFAYAWEANWNGDWNAKNPATAGQTAPGYGTAGGHGANGGFWSQINKAHEALQHLNVTWSFRTYEKGRENFYVRWSE